VPAKFPIRCYHNQRNGLRTSSPHVLPEPSSLPADADPAKLREHELTRAGFIPGQGHATAYLYRAFRAKLDTRRQSNSWRRKTRPRTGEPAPLTGTPWAETIEAKDDINSWQV
jgi:hypothetical protein